MIKISEKSTLILLSHPISCFNGTSRNGNHQETKIDFILEWRNFIAKKTK